MFLIIMLDASGEPYFMGSFFVLEKKLCIVLIILRRYDEGIYVKRLLSTEILRFIQNNSPIFKKDLQK